MYIRIYYKKNVKGALRCQNGLIFGSVVSQTVLYLSVKFCGNPSFVWRSAAVLVLGFNRGHVRVLCFFFWAKNPKSKF